MKMKRQIQEYSYPENLVRDIGVNLICRTDDYSPLSEEQAQRLERAVSRIEPHMYQELIGLRYQEGLTYQQIAEKMGFATKDLARRFIEIALKRLREQYGVPYRKTKPKTRTQ